MPGTIELKTPRLSLRRHVAKDAKELHENFGLNKAMYEHSGWNPYATLEDAEKTVSHFMASYEDPHFYGWAIEYTGKLVGTVGAYDYDAEKNTIEIGVSIEEASWGKGFATEALSAALRYLADEEGIATVTAWCSADNIGSQRALEKAGMKQSGREDGGLELGGTKHDKINYAYMRGDSNASERRLP